MTPKKLRKIVIPVAGYGTRFLPFTKAQPKEMIPVIDKPVIQYVVENAVAAGFNEVILVTSSNKRSIEDHFDSNFELEHKLKKAGKAEALEAVRHATNLAKFIFVRQPEPLGNGHAVLMAREVVGDEPFAMVWGDEILISEPPVLKQLRDCFEKYHKSTIVLIRSPKDKFEEYCSKYGCADVEDLGNGEFRVKGVIEKPDPKDAPSDLFSVGGWIFEPKIMEILAGTKSGKGGEIWLQDAVDVLAKAGELYGKEMDCKYYDIGSKHGFLRATIDFALEREDTKKELAEYLRGLKI
ncbi:MAG TPA: UTP--glucose-1-phosphate uridylyltransferase [Patescibacteria group bacterium]|nr:UTP--glucose-1-phosphate uridylyltransferase [Patescibacteria group bacterium]